MLWTLFLPFLLFFSTFSTTAVFCSSCVASEREALLDFKHNVHDPQATLTSWSGSDCCRWKGVKCSNGTNGHVIKLNLRKVLDDDRFYPPGLQGEIVPSLCQLKRLQQLHLGYNSFSGQIPVFFGCFQELTYLNISHANFSGTIPPQLGNLSKLQILDLSGEGSLAVYDAGWLKLLTSLKVLDMSGVNLQNSTNFFQSLNLLPSLSVLCCDGCGIRSLPESLPHYINFTSLAALDLYNNAISTIPEWLFTLTSLQYLYLGGTHSSDDTKTEIEGIGNLVSLIFLGLSEMGLSGSFPVSLLKLSALETLRLDNNKLSGPIPDVFGSIQSLKELDLSDNHLSGSIPTSLGSMSNLTWLDLSNNHLSGSIPTSIARLSMLELLNLELNELSGSIPTSWVRMPNLLELDLSGNKLNGSIPESLCGLPIVQTLDLSNNFHLNGSIPECIGQLKELQDLQLEMTNLSGVISESHFANLTKLTTLSISSSSGSLSMNVPWNWNPPFQLQSLSLDSCKMRTRFPTWIRNHSGIFDLSVTNAEIYGELPAWIWNITYVGWLDLSSNNLSGHLPGFNDNLQLLDHMNVVNLSLNKFEGKIPSSFCNMSADIMDLSRNQLSGELPGCLLDGISQIRLANNNLSGSIPNLTEPERCNIYTLQLENNNLSGVLPSTLKFCSTIQIIDVGGNKLSGNIPEWLGESMSSLEFLNLRDNNFSGVIPSNMSGLSSLRFLDLAGNKLLGQIPYALKYCSTIEAIDVRGNELSGKIPAWLGENMPYLKILKLRDNNFSGRIPSNMSSLSSLRILDLAGNKLSGQIPYTFGNFTAMMNKSASDSEYVISISIIVKKHVLTYTVLPPHMVSIDISRNRLSGKIPSQLGSLVILRNLNFSHNLLSDNIPTKICELSNLESLDLSRNHLSGQIPKCMASMSEMGSLDLSHNNLSGRIPWEGQMTTFSEEYFEGNFGLCGSPLLKMCEGNERSTPSSIPVLEDQKTYGREKLWVYVSILLGFIVGFWTFYGTLFFKDNWRYAYFHFLGETNFMLYFRFRLLRKRLFK